MRTTTTTRPPAARHRAAECRHGIPAEWCSICAHPRTVYISAGGTHYHSDPRCPSLRSGQDQVIARGGVPAPIVNVSESRALEDGRDRCHTCW